MNRVGCFRKLDQNHGVEDGLGREKDLGKGSYCHWIALKEAGKSLGARNLALVLDARHCGWQQFGDIGWHQGFIQVRQTLLGRGLRPEEAMGRRGGYLQRVRYRVTRTHHQLVRHPGREAAKINPTCRCLIAQLSAQSPGMTPLPTGSPLTLQLWPNVCSPV